MNRTHCGEKRRGKKNVYLQFISKFIYTKQSDDACEP